MTRHDLGVWDQASRAWQCRRCGAWTTEYQVKMDQIAECDGKPTLEERLDSLLKAAKEASTKMEELALWFEEAEARRSLNEIREPLDAAIRQCEEDDDGR